jgi:hypothetical protein
LVSREAVAEEEDAVKDASLGMGRSSSIEAVIAQLYAYGI